MREGIKPPIDIELNIRVIERPLTWRKEPYILSYLLVGREVSPEELVILLRWATVLQLPNPRVITPELIRWSSLFHPRFFMSVYRDSPVSVTPMQWVENSLPNDFQSLSRLWLQSVLFLSGVTLSAAVVQQRYSVGTIESKLDRLWDAGTFAAMGLAPELEPLKLHDQINALAANHSDELARLLQLREIFMQTLKLIAPSIGTREMMRQILPTRYPDRRFEFVEELLPKLSWGLRAVIVYGSSVLSDQFADIDALVIVNDPVAVLKQMAGSKPMWLGKELNLGIYSPDELIMMQYLSGDNLFDYGVCIWGEAEVVRKPIANLLARNFSFGVVRQRQQFGMLTREITAQDTVDSDRQNLYEYFVKIPANVAKGTLSAVGNHLPKEQIHGWLSSIIGFDTLASQKQVMKGNVVSALAASTCATGQVLSALNTQLNVVRASELSDKESE